MVSNLNHILLRSELTKSEAYGVHYNEMLNRRVPSSFSTPIPEELEEIYTHIVEEHDGLTDFQKASLGEIITAMNRIRVQIDPNRLKSFKSGRNDDGDLLLYRQSKLGLINLIIHDDECIAYSFIGNEQGRALEFFEDDIDYELLVLKFFSK